MISKENLEPGKWYEGFVFRNHRQNGLGVLCWDGEVFENPHTDSDLVWLYYDPANMVKYQFEPRDITEDPDDGSDQERKQTPGANSAGGAAAAQFERGSQA